MKVKLFEDFINEKKFSTLPRPLQKSIKPTKKKLFKDNSSVKFSKNGTIIDDFGDELSFKKGDSAKLKYKCGPIGCTVLVTYKGKGYNMSDIELVDFVKN